MKTKIVGLGIMLTVLAGPHPAVAIDTLVSTPPVGNGCYSSLSAKLLVLGNRAYWLWGGHAASLLEHRVVLGGAMYGFMDPVLEKTVANETQTLDWNYGGLEAGYILNPDTLTHLVLMVQAGFGALTRAQGARVERDIVFTVEPSVAVVLNVTTWARLSLGVGYLFAGGVDTPGFDDQDLSGLSVDVMIKAGVF